MTKIIFATGNAGKMREIRDIMADLDVELLSMKEAGIKLDIVEDGKTFEENALIKARAVSKEAPGAIVMADDSGLEVDYLHKKPGIYSARFIGEDISYDIKNQADFRPSGRCSKGETNCPLRLFHCSSAAGWKGICDKRDHGRLYRG